MMQWSDKLFPGVWSPRFVTLLGLVKNIFITKILQAYLHASVTWVFCLAIIFVLPCFTNWMGNFESLFGISWKHIQSRDSRELMQTVNLHDHIEPTWVLLGYYFRSVCSAMRRCPSEMFFVAVRRTRSCLKLLALLLTGRKSSMQVSVGFLLLFSMCIEWRSNLYERYNSVNINVFMYSCYNGNISSVVCPI